MPSRLHKLIILAVGTLSRPRDISVYISKGYLIYFTKRKIALQTRIAPGNLDLQNASPSLGMAIIYFFLEIAFI